LNSKTEPHRNVATCTKYFDKSMTWMEASEKCEKKQAHLAHIANSDINEELIQILRSAQSLNPNEKATGVWIGYSDAQQDWHKNYFSMENR